MATYTALANEDTTTASYMGYMTNMDKALVQFGWMRSNDTGQATYAGTYLKTISSVSGSGTVVTVTYDDTVRIGPALAVGAQIQLNGVATTTAYNGTWIITGLTNQGTTTATFTFSSATTGAATGTPTAQLNDFVAITHVTGNGSQAVYSYDDTVRFGNPLQPGMLITTLGCITAGFNVTSQLIQSVSGAGTSSATFTINNTTNVTESESGATGSVPTQTVSTTSFEIWKTQDALSSGAQWYFKFSATANGSNPVFTVQVGTGSNGSGTLTGAGNAISFATSTNSGTNFGHFMSGDAGNFRMLLWHGANPQVYLSLERSVDTTGTYTGTYYTVCYGEQTQSYQQQTVMFLGGVSTLETAGLCCAIPKTAATGNFGVNTMVCPVIPLIGGQGNPLIGTLLFRATDFADNTRVNATLYNVTHAYLAIGMNNSTTNGTAVNAGILMQFE